MEHSRPELQRILGGVVKSAPREEAHRLAWPMVCGANVASRTRVLGFKGGVVQIEVPDKAWRNQLGELAGQYLKALNEVLGGRVERILFVLPGEPLNGMIRPRQNA